MGADSQYRAHRYAQATAGWALRPRHQDGGRTRHTHQPGPDQALRHDAVRRRRPGHRTRPYSLPGIFHQHGVHGAAGRRHGNEDRQQSAALNPPHSTWRNRVAARALLATGSYRPGKHAEAIACPIFYCIGERDVLIAPDMVQRRSARRAVRSKATTAAISISTWTRSGPSRWRTRPRFCCDICDGERLRPRSMRHR